MNKMPIIILFVTWWILSLMLMFMFHHAYKPMFMILTLIMYTLMMCFFIILWTWESLYSIIMFLIMISGMFTMFMYFASLINNEQQLTNTPPIMYLFMFVIFTTLLMLMSSIFMMHHTAMKPATNQTHVVTVQTTKDIKSVSFGDTILTPSILKDKQLNYTSTQIQSSETISTPTPSAPSDYSSSLTMMYQNPWCYVTIMCILLLLLTLFMTIKICSIQNKSMRKMNK